MYRTHVELTGAYSYIACIRVARRIGFLCADYYALKHVLGEHHHFLYFEAPFFRPLLHFPHHWVMRHSINEFYETA